MEPSMGWDAETARLIEWFRTAELPSGPFDLGPGIRVIEPEGYRHALLCDIAAGPDGPRARMGVLQDELARLRELFGRGR